MKEIKFRAWDNQQKKWITEPLGFTMSVVDHKFHVFGFNDAFADMYQIRVELQQFTGLKDKNGVEIYEGDILSFSFGDGDTNKSIHAVQYGGSSYDHNGSTYGFNMGDDYGYREPKVIGNIHENPELIK